MKCEIADDLAGGVAGEDGVGVGELHDLGGVEFEDKAENAGERGVVSGERTEESGSFVAPSDLLRSGRRVEPAVFLQEGEDVGGGEGIEAGFEFGRF